MAIKCPKCHFENPGDTVYCGKCATPLPASEGISVSHTEATETQEQKLISMDTSMKTREQYLVEYEKKLLGILKDLYKSINYNFITTYSLSILVTLFYWGSITEFGFFGAKITLSRTDMLIFIPIIISIIYILINYQLIRIAALYRQINKNAVELLSINQNAKPITISEIHLFGAGITGLILSLSRWQANRLIKRNPFKFRIFEKKDPSKEDNIFMLAWQAVNEVKQIPKIIYRMFKWFVIIGNWFSTVAVRSLITLSLFLLPLILVGYSVYKEFFYSKPFKFEMPLFSFSIMILIGISIIVCGLILLASYFVDLIEYFKKDFKDSTGEVKRFYDLIKIISRAVNPFIS